MEEFNFEKEGKMGEYAMKCVGADALLFGFLSLRNVQTIKPTTAWAVVGFETRFKNEE